MNFFDRRKVKKSELPANKRTVYADQYIVMDLENPNVRGNSICQIALVIVKQGEITKSISTYINPEDRFDPENIKIHGITRQKVVDAPTLPDFWEKTHGVIEENIIVGHNITYDLSVLSKSLDRYGIDVPVFRYIDTLALSRDCLKSDDYQLKTLSKKIGFSYTAHDAMEDALACRNLYEYLTDHCAAEPEIKKYEYTFRLSQNLDARLEASINEFYGIVNGIASDGRVDENEVQLLIKWRDDNRINKQYAAFYRILSKLDDILEDGVVTELERVELVSIVENISSSRMYSDATLAIQVLNGFIKGIVSDSRIEIDELGALRNWLERHNYLEGVYPYDKILLVVSQVLEDGILTEDEKNTVFKLFDEILNPVKDELAESSMKGKTFCLTGDFTGFSRTEVTQKLLALGAIERKGVSSKLDYLFVGGEGSQAWKYGEYGGKIAKAMEVQEKGGKVKIIAQSEMNGIL